MPMIVLVLIVRVLVLIVLVLIVRVIVLIVLVLIVIMLIVLVLAVRVLVIMGRRSRLPRPRSQTRSPTWFGHNTPARGKRRNCRPAATAKNHSKIIWRNSFRFAKANCASTCASA